MTRLCRPSLPSVSPSPFFLQLFQFHNPRAAPAAGGGGLGGEEEDGEFGGIGGGGAGFGSASARGGRGGPLSAAEASRSRTAKRKQTAGERETRGREESILKSLLGASALARADVHVSVETHAGPCV